MNCAKVYSGFGSRCDRAKGHAGPCSGSLPLKARERRRGDRYARALTIYLDGNDGLAAAITLARSAK